MVNTEIRLIIFFAVKDGEVLYSQQKQDWEFIFQCSVFLLFHTIHGVLKARILKWFAIPFSSGLHFVRTLHHNLSIMSPTQHGS